MRLLKIIKIIVALTLLIAGLGYCGQMDSEYEAQRTMMAEQQPRRTQR